MRKAQVFVGKKVGTASEGDIKLYGCHGPRQLSTASNCRLGSVERARRYGTERQALAKSLAGEER